MATIGTFTRNGDGFTGAVRTLTLNVKAKLVTAGKDNDKGPDYRIFAGKMVENVVRLDAADKSDAVHLLVRHSGAGCAVFMGDDVNDEPVFASAPPDWVTIRVGRDDHASRAAFFLDSTAEVAMLLDRMLAHLGA